MLTYLAIIFVLTLIAAIMYGFGIFMRRPPTREELLTEKCSICREPRPKEEMVERQIGDYKVLWFCRSCITDLHHEASGPPKA